MKIKSLETFCRGTQLGVVRVRTDDGAEGWGQISTYNADLAAAVLHRQLAPCTLGADALEIETLVDRCIEAFTKIGKKHGVRIEITLEGSYNKGRQSLDEYVKQTAIANPHALIFYRSPTGEHREFPRGTDELPAETKEIKPHPYGIELGVLMKMLKDSRPRRKGERGVPGTTAEVEHALTGSNQLQHSLHVELV